jgi:hypothetical protein
LGSSPHNDRTLVRLSTPGFTVTTRNIAARVSGVTTGCGATREGLAVAAVVIEPASGIAIFAKHLSNHQREIARFKGNSGFCSRPSWHELHTDSKSA